MTPSVSSLNVLLDMPFRRRRRAAVSSLLDSSLSSFVVVVSSSSSSSSSPPCPSSSRVASSLLVLSLDAFSSRVCDAGRRLRVADGPRLGEPCPAPPIASRNRLRSSSVEDSPLPLPPLLPCEDAQRGLWAGSEVLRACLRGLVRSTSCFGDANESCDHVFCSDEDRSIVPTSLSLFLLWVRYARSSLLPPHPAKQAAICWL